MGIFGRNEQAVLSPQNPPLGIFPQYCVQGPTILILKEKVWSWSGDDFAVKDDKGVPVVIIKGKAMSWRDRKIVSDTSGKELFHITNKLISLRKTILGTDQSENRELFKVVKKISFGAKIIATFTDAQSGKPVELYLRGDFWGGSADISIGDGGPVIAQISRDLWKMREIFSDKQTYYVTVAPGVDLALISALCVSFDECMNENNGS